MHARTRLPVDWTYAWLRRFHAPAQAVMVPTASIEDDLRRRGFRRLARWSRGVDAELFRPGERLDMPWQRPVHMYVGRVAVEKNLGDFLALPLPGSKVIVGDGPQRAELESRHPEAHFVGTCRGESLAAHFRSADVFVFPSRTDTFGLVLLEAMASGTPVAAYPVPGPLDVVEHGSSGVLNVDLAEAARQALMLDRKAVRAHALQYSWERANRQFLCNLRPADVVAA